MIVLDVGCGTAKIPGAIGLDRLPLPGVDIVCDLSHFPWPIDDSRVEKLIFTHSIQYFGPFQDLLEEIKRFCDSGALIEITSPHFSSYNYFSDPLYRFPLAWRSFDFWSPDSMFKYNYYGARVFAFEVLERKIIFNNGISCQVRFTGSLANVRPVLWASDLFVLPSSKREGFGLSGC